MGFAGKHPDHFFRIAFVFRLAENLIVCDDNSIAANDDRIRMILQDRSSLSCGKLFDFFRQWL